MDSPLAKEISALSRDWSAWIDTIETLSFALSFSSDIPSGRDWSAWIDTIETSKIKMKNISTTILSGLICLNWYDWNPHYYLLQIHS